MEAKKAKELAARILKVGVGRIHLNPDAIAKIAEAMTKDDIRGLIAERIIKKKPSAEQSRGRARELQTARAKGRHRGKGKRSATRKRRSEQKSRWMWKVRSLRRTLREIKKENPDAVKAVNYSAVYSRINGNYFRGKRHLTEYVEGAKK
ncbi:MAG: 50S ribosomal protein L19e [Candidatus Diapherotrites archaeon]|nr:50S ribosomal protein L19e [Candidatus Diapherotrites archaeon]